MKGQRLAASNYLKTPRVFGFFGVYSPLATGLRVADPERLPLERCAELTHAWESEQGLHGFTDSAPRTPGGTFRNRLEAEVRSSLTSGRCTVAANSSLFGTVAASLRPMGADRRERQMLRS